jgi:hypothetical protein
MIKLELTTQASGYKSVTFRLLISWAVLDFKFQIDIQLADLD